MKTDKKIGKINITNLSLNNGPEYSDGDVEDTLLELFKKGLSEKRRTEILNNNPLWPIRYHLAPERGNLINWYKFSNGSRVLEVGSGCGAITEAIIQNEKIDVVANELSQRRAIINAYRNKNAKNLEIVIGNLQDYSPKVKFDYVVCVGVLEYAGTFIDAGEPYSKFLELLASFLKPQGKILVAIENRLGFKYLSGAKEDHTGGYYDGINNYPQRKNVRTFGRQELIDLLSKSGFTVEEFYYPHPDYKLPKIVYSDSYLPGDKTFVPKNLLPSPSFDQTRKVLFSEELFLDAIESNNVYKDFSNSFLVEAVYGKTKIENTSVEKVVFGLNRINRDDKYKIRTTAIKKDDSLIFRKEALNEEAKAHINRLTDTYGLLEKRVNNSNLVSIVKPLNVNIELGVAEFPYQPGENAESTLIKAIINDDYKRAEKIYRQYKEILKKFSDPNSLTKINKNQRVIFGDDLYNKFETGLVITEGILDFNLDNFIIDEATNMWWLIDYEWRVDMPIPTEFIEYRGMLAFLSRYKDMIISRGFREEVISNGILAIPKMFMELINYELSKLDFAYDIENSHIQPWILGDKFVVDPPGRYKRTTPQEYFIDQADRLLISKDESIVELRNENIRLSGEIHKLQTHIASVEASNSYKLAKKAASAKNKIIRKRN